MLGRTFFILIFVARRGGGGDMGRKVVGKECALIGIKKIWRGKVF